MSKKVYAVKKPDKYVGVYKTWQEIEKIKNKCKFLSFKSFKSEEEAKTWLNKKWDDVYAFVGVVCEDVFKGYNYYVFPHIEDEYNLHPSPFYVDNALECVNSKEKMLVSKNFKETTKIMLCDKIMKYLFSEKCPYSRIYFNDAKCAERWKGNGLVKHLGIKVICDEESSTEGMKRCLQELSAAKMIQESRIRRAKKGYKVY
jgi:hypothetical protein